ncbi:MAG: arylesterase [Chitinophagaceae bacterium]|nr:arylesterase [Chitinophagaceae bacterium]
MRGKKYLQQILCCCTAWLLLFVAACNNQSNEPATENKADSTTGKTQPAGTAKKNIVFFGNSLTAGYGLDLAEAFPAIIQQKLDSLHYPYKAVNAGLSGETTAGGKSRVDWILQQPVDIFVLELGGNDGLRGIALQETSQNLQAIIDKVKAKYPDAKILLTGMRVPPNLGKKYADEFQQLYKALADKNKLAFLPFLLEGVGGEEKLNQADGIHPTAEGQKIVAGNVWEVLKKML